MFNEKSTEFSKKQQKQIPVWQSPKYIEAKEQAIKLINQGQYDLVEADFWILMNETQTGKMGYSGLIISHNGCLKINEKLDNKVNPKCFSCDKEGYKGSLVYTYYDDELYEVGEVSTTNCKNEYPYAMAFKRCFDRVVLKKCKLAYAGIYSDSEAEEFRRKDEEETPEIDTREWQVTPLVSTEQAQILKKTAEKYKLSDEDVKRILSEYNYKSLEEVRMSDYAKIGHALSKE